MTTLPPPRRFCDSACRRAFHELADRDEQDLDPKLGHCWLCRCALPDEAPDERFFLARAEASAAYHYGTSHAVLRLGDLQVVAVEPDDLDEAMERFFNGMHLAGTDAFTSIAAAYEAARADLRRRRYLRPACDAVGPLTFRSGATLLGRRIDRDGVPALEACLTNPRMVDATWVIRTGARNVREVDRALRGFGVPYATILGARLWVELGLPLPATR